MLETDRPVGSFWQMPSLRAVKQLRGREMGCFVAVTEIDGSTCHRRRAMQSQTKDLEADLLVSQGAGGGGDGSTGLERGFEYLGNPEMRIGLTLRGGFLDVCGPIEFEVEGTISRLERAWVFTRLAK